MNQVNVSIVTIVKNDFDKIEYTMKSVLQQTYNNFEYIIKDGVSKDGTLDMISKVIEAYPQQSVKLISSTDESIYDAMNQSISYCKGKWIIFINSGDAFYNSKVLEKIFMNESEFYNAGVLYGDVIVCDEAGKAVWAADIDFIKKKMPFCHQSCFIRRELLLRFPFMTDYEIAADYNNILDLYFCGESFFYYGEIVAYFDLTGISSKKFVKRYKEKVKILKRHDLYRNNSCIYISGLCWEYIKTIVDYLIPDFLKRFMKNWYKFHIKKYKKMSA